MKFLTNSGKFDTFGNIYGQLVLISHDIMVININMIYD